MHKNGELHMKCLRLLDGMHKEYGGIKYQKYKIKP